MEPLHLDEDGERERRIFGQTKRFWKIALIVGGVLLASAVIAIIIVLTTTGGLDTRQGYELEDALNPNFVPAPFEATWGIDELIYADNEGDLVGFHKQHHNISALLPPKFLNLKTVHNWAISADNQYVMVEEVFVDTYGLKQSFYRVINLITLAHTQVSLNGETFNIQMAAWSTAGNALVFVQSNTMYYKASVTANPILVTLARNVHESVGFTNYIYEHAIFSAETAVWFSPDGSTVALALFDDSEVKRMRLPVFGVPGTLQSQYPGEHGVTYPKPGTTHPAVTLMYFSTRGVTDGVNVSVALPPRDLSLAETILTGVSWASNGKLVAMWTNRVQNEAELRTCEVGVCADVKTITADKGWLEPNQPMVFSRNDANLVAMIEFRDMNDNETGAFAHISLTNIRTGSRFFVTGGSLNVATIAHWDPLNDLIFFHGNTDQRTEQTHLYVVRAVPDQVAFCISCTIEFDNVHPTVVRAQFDTRSQHFVLHISGPSVPRTELYAWRYQSPITSLFHITHVRTLDANAGIRDRISIFAEPLVRYLDVPLSVEGLTARVKLIVPPGVTLGGSVKMPLLVQAFAGPASYSGTDDWAIGWATYLATRRSVVTAVIDARTMGRRSDRYRFAGYRHLGSVEVEDQIYVAEKLTTLLPYVDATRVGIWGRGYGGYVATAALGADTHNVFRCAASVSGVTDWMYYNSMYTERYMGLPTEADNEAGYTNSSLLHKIERLRGKHLYLVHGTKDDDVHYQHMMALARRLELADVAFEQMSYTDEGHPIGGAQPHLYHGLNRFFSECFGSLV